MLIAMLQVGTYKVISGGESLKLIVLPTHYTSQINKQEENSLMEEAQSLVLLMAASKLDTVRDINKITA